MYQGPAAAAQEILFFEHLLCGLQHQQQQPTSLGEDNQSAMKLSTNPVFHKGSKHIDVKQHFLRYAVQKDETLHMCQPKKWQAIFSLKDFVKTKSLSIVRVLWAE